MKTVGAYRLVHELARGGMGVVFEAVHVETGARYALKMVTPDLIGSVESEELARFRREAEAMGRLSHPNVGRVHTAELDGAEPYLVQDLLSGGTLQERIAAGPMPIEDVVAIVVKLAHGLQHCHERGILHRDLKPLNVLFDERGEPRLVDFGLAYAVDVSQRMTQSGTVMGTPSHMAPEQATGSGDVDARTDVYGLGAILHHCLVGSPPFRAGSVVATLHAVTTKAPMPPSRERPEVPVWLDAVVLRALEKDPSARFPSAAALAEALEAGGRARPNRSKSARALPALMVVALAALAGAAIHGLGGPETPSPETPDGPAPARSVQERRTLEDVLAKRADPLTLALDVVEWLGEPAAPVTTEQRRGLSQRFAGPLLRKRVADPCVLSARFFGRETRQVAVLGYERLAVWSLVGGHDERVIGDSFPGARLAVQPGSDALVVAPREGTLQIRNLGGVSQDLELEKKRICALALTKSGSTLAVGAMDALQLWTPNGLRLLTSGEEWVRALSFVETSGALLVARGSDDQKLNSSFLEVWTEEPRGSWAARPRTNLGAMPTCLAVDPSGTLAAVGDKAGCIRLVSLVEPDRPPSFLLRDPQPKFSANIAHLNRISSLRFSADGARLYSASGAQTSIDSERQSELSVWRIGDREQIRREPIGGSDHFLSDFDLLGPGDELLLLTLQGRPGTPQFVELWWREALLPRED